MCGDSLRQERSSNPTTGGGSSPTSPLQLVVKSITKNQAAQFYKKWHYLGGQGFLACHNFGAFYEDVLVGSISFHPPSAVQTVKGLFGTTDQRGFWEIGRLAMTDSCPQNSESRFIRVSLRLLQQMLEVRAVITYADSSVGHTGVVYKAAGFKYLGLTASKKDFWVGGKIKQRGRTRGVNGEWRPRPRKHLFVLVLDDTLPLLKKEVEWNNGTSRRSQGAL